tara:strand:+ start:716 stop:1324 length:609 start_codon:yes stop_codon:yes gene_type:complete
VKDLAVIDLLSDESLKALADKIAGSHSEDLIQEVALLLLEMDEEKWISINENGALRWYVVRTMLNMATSNRSTFASKYELNKSKTELVDIPNTEGYDFEKEADISLLETFLERQHWYDRDMLKLYLREGSYRKVSKITNIPFKSVGNTVKKTIKRIKLDYYGHHIERTLRSSGLSNLRGDTKAGLEDQEPPESTRGDGTETT